MSNIISLLQARWKTNARGQLPRGSILARGQRGHERTPHEHEGRLWTLDEGWARWADDAAKRRRWHGRNGHGRPKPLEPGRKHGRRWRHGPHWLGSLEPRWWYELRHGRGHGRRNGRRHGRRDGNGRREHGGRHGGKYGRWNGWRYGRKRGMEQWWNAAR